MILGRRKKKPPNVPLPERPGTAEPAPAVHAAIGEPIPDNAPAPQPAPVEQTSITEKGHSMLTYLASGDKLEIHRIAGELPNQTFSFVGVINIVTAKEAKPFLDGLSADEQSKVKEFQELALSEYRRARSVDVRKIVADLLDLAQAVHFGFSSVSPAEDAQLVLAFQRVRNTVKRVREEKQ